MKFAHFFIDRPIFSAVISIILVIAGTVAMLNLPIAQFPDITPPQISVSATYPGANAEVVAENVAAPIEQQVNGADYMMYMNSTASSTGNMTLSIFFEIGTDPALAQVDVQNRVNLALPFLPSAVSAQGVSVAKKSSAFMMVIAVYAPDERYDANFVNNFTNINILDAIKRIPGANQSALLGYPDYAMRLWLKPDRMASLGLTATDIQNAVAAQNQQYAAGRLGASPTTAPVQQTPGHDLRRMTGLAVRRDLLRAQRARARSSAVGHRPCELSAEDSIRDKYSGQTATLLHLPGGLNALQVIRTWGATPTIRRPSQAGMRDRWTAEFVRSRSRGGHTFVEAMVWWSHRLHVPQAAGDAGLILAVLLSIISAFIGMMRWAPVNMLTLFGMVLSRSASS
jgi:multidrug efflux pump